MEQNQPIAVELVSTAQKETCILLVRSDRPIKRTMFVQAIRHFADRLEDDINKKIVVPEKKIITP